MTDKDVTYDEAELTDDYTYKTDGFSLVKEVNPDRFLFADDHEYAFTAISDGELVIEDRIGRLPVVDFFAEVRTFDSGTVLHGLDGDLTVVTIYDENNEIVERSVLEVFGYTPANFDLGLKQSKKRLRHHEAKKAQEDRPNILTTKGGRIVQGVYGLNSEGDLHHIGLEGEYEKIRNGELTAEFLHTDSDEVEVTIWSGEWDIEGRDVVEDTSSAYSRAEEMIKLHNVQN